MGIYFRKKIKLPDGTTINLGKNGISSISKKVGNVTINSKGTITANLGNGVIFRESIKPKKNKKSKKS